MPLNRLIDSGQPIIPPTDVQHTTLGIDVLSPFVCNTWGEATSEGAGALAADAQRRCKRNRQGADTLSHDFRRAAFPAHQIQRHKSRARYGTMNFSGQWAEIVAIRPTVAHFDGQQRNGAVPRRKSGRPLGRLE